MGLSYGTVMSRLEGTKRRAFSQLFQGDYMCVMSVF